MNTLAITILAVVVVVALILIAVAFFAGVDVGKTIIQ